MLAADLTMSQFGQYCSACERFLWQGGRAWHAETGRGVPRTGGPDDWPALFVLCRNCADAAGSAAGDAHLLPDRDTTFSLGEGAPISYEARPVPDEAAVLPNGSQVRVIAVPHTPRAAETIRLFQLNGAFEPSGDVVALPQGMDLVAYERDDRRLELRTQAWHSAHLMARQIGLYGGDPTVRAGLTTQSRAHAAGSGFWSVWAAVLWAELGDPELLRSALLSPLQHPHTRDDWLPGTATDVHPG